MPTTPDPSLIQMYCDGECTPEQCAAIEQYLASDAEVKRQVDAQIKFNKQLCESLRGSMGASLSGDASADMLARIRGALNEGTSPVAIARRRRWSIGTLIEDPRKGNIFAVAATLLIVAGAMLYGIFGRSIDDIVPNKPSDVFASAALFAESEHARYTGSTQKQAELAKRVDAAEHDMSRWLDAPVQIPDLEDQSYQFIGAGLGGIPDVSARSGHIMYRKMVANSNGRTPMVSVFVFPNRGQCGGNLCKGMNSREWYECANGKCKHRVLRSTDGKLVYVMVCCNDNDIDGVAKVMSQTLQQPSR